MRCCRARCRSDTRVGACVVDLSPLEEWHGQPHAVWLVLHHEEGKVAQPDKAEVLVPVRANTHVAAVGPTVADAVQLTLTHTDLVGGLHGAGSGGSSADGGMIGGAHFGGDSGGGGLLDASGRFAMPELPPPPIDSAPCLLVQFVYTPHADVLPRFHIAMPPTVATAGLGVGSGMTPHDIPAALAAGSGRSNRAGSIAAGRPPPSATAGSASASGGLHESASSGSLVGVGGGGTGSHFAFPTTAGNSRAGSRAPSPSPSRDASAAATGVAAASGSGASGAADKEIEGKLQRLAGAYQALRREKAALETRVAELTAEAERLRPVEARLKEVTTECDKLKAALAVLIKRTGGLPGKAAGAAAAGASAAPAAPAAASAPAAAPAAAAAAPPAVDAAPAAPAAVAAPGPTVGKAADDAIAALAAAMEAHHDE